MAWGKPKEPTQTRPQLVQHHREQAEDLLRRAGKAGRLESQTRMATMATAHATLAVSYQLADPPSQL